MKLKTSFFNPTIFKKNITRFWPLWALPSIISIVVAFSNLINNKINISGTVRVQANVLNYQTRLNYFNALCQSSNWIMLFMAIFAIMATFNYMFNNKGISMFHSIPVSRKGLFISNYVSALTIIMIPIIVFVIFNDIFMLTLGAYDFQGTFTYLIGTLLLAIVYLSFAVLAASLTGNSIVLPILYGVLLILPLSVEGIIDSFSSSFLFGYEGKSDFLMQFTCPTYFILDKVSVNDELYNPVSIEGFKYIVFYAIAGIIITVISYFIYKNKKSESATEIIAIKPIKYILQFIFLICFSLGIGWMFYSILGFDDYITVNKPVITLCVCLAGIIGFYCTKMLFNKTAKVFNKKNFIGASVTAVSLLIICLAISFDVFNIEGMVPYADKIQSVTVSQGDLYTTIDAKTNPENVNRLRELHSFIIADKEQLSNIDRYEGRTTGITFVYTLKDGSRLSRTYYIVVDNFPQKETFISCIQDLTIAKLRNVSAEYSLNNIFTCYSTENGSNAENYANPEANKLLKAVMEDMDEGRFHYEPVSYNYDKYDYIITLDLSFNQYYGKNYRDSCIMFAVNPEMTSTYAALKELGFKFSIAP